MTEYTEEDLNNLVASRLSNMRLDRIDKQLEEINELILEQNARTDDRLHEAEKEKERCEREIKASILNVERTMFETFVKKQELKLYAALVIFSVTAATAALNHLHKAREDNIVMKHQQQIVRLLQAIEKK